MGLRIPEGAALTPEVLIRHSAFRTLDHAREMEDKDLTAVAPAVGAYGSRVRIP